MAWSGSESNYQDFINRHGLTFPNIDDSPGDLFESNGVRSQPAWAMITPDGQTKIINGAISGEKLAEQLTLLSQN